MKYRLFVLLLFFSYHIYTMNRSIFLIGLFLLSLTTSAQSIEELERREAELSIKCAELLESGDTVKCLECIEERNSILMKQLDILHSHHNILRSQNLGFIDSVFYSKRRNPIMDKSRELYEFKKNKNEDVISYASLGDSCNAVKDTISAIQYFMKADSIGVDYMCYLSDDEIETMANSNYALGWYYYYGVCVAADHKRALYHYLRAAYLGHTDAQVAIGRISLTETGLPRNLFLPYWYFENYRQANAMYWLGEAAEKGNAEARQLLTWCYYDKEDADNVILWGTKEECRDSADIQSIVGWAYYAKSDYANAVLWLEKAAKQNDAYACWLLACMNENELNNPTASFNYLQKAADMGYPNALDDMGVNYINGDMVKQDFNTAVSYFQQAADKGCLDAWEHMGIIYYWRQYGHVNRTKAASYWKQGAEAGSVACQYKYGYLLKKGKGVKKDKEEAVKWFTIAAQNGSEDAKEELTRMKISIEENKTESQMILKRFRVVDKDFMSVKVVEE